MKKRLDIASKLAILPKADKLHFDHPFIITPVLGSQHEVIAFDCNLQKGFRACSLDHVSHQFLITHDSLSSIFTMVDLSNILCFVCTHFFHCGFGKLIVKAFTILGFLYMQIFSILLSFSSCPCDS